MTMASEYPARATAGRGLGDEVVYFRRPFRDREGNPAQNAGWITWCDTLSGTKMRDFEYRGFTSLRKYGQMNNERRLRALRDKGQEEGWSVRQFQAEWVWGGILRHPDGPAEFPLDQIMTLRWYEKAHCPIKDVDPIDLFPQLKGHRVKKYPCPQCNRDFAEVDGQGASQPFANHLRIHHDYDMQNILNYGDRIGLDFSAVEHGDRSAEEIVFGEAESEPDGLTCEDCGQLFGGKMAAAHLSKHMKDAHPAFEVETA